MLSGRGGPDQIRLGHVLDQAERELKQDWDPVRLLQAARDYRARFPDSLEAAMEEADALLNMASDAPGQAPEAIAELRTLLLGVLRRAPSYPKTYLRLAGLAEAAMDRSPEGSPGPFLRKTRT